MNELVILLAPRTLAVRNRIKYRSKSTGSKLAFMGMIGAAFWALIFYVFYRVLGYFQGVEDFGDVLAYKLLSVVILTFFSVLIFSNVVAAISTFFLAKDLELVHATPASREGIFWSRWVNTIVDSSWMVLIFGAPVFLAYGVVYSAGLGFYLTLLSVFLTLIMISSALGVLVVQALVNVFPARRMRDILFFLGIVAAILVYFLFRFIRPERLVNPEGFATMVLYFREMKGVHSVFLPSHWVTETLWGMLSPEMGAQTFFHLLLWSTTLALIVITTWVGGWLYHLGWSRSLEGKKSRRLGRSFLDGAAGIFTFYLRPDIRSVIQKDFKTFFRDNNQWSQLFLLAALVVVYLYNFSVLPVDIAAAQSYYLVNLLAFLNLGLAGFVLAAVAVRFVFPVVSLEGPAFWLIRSSPMSIKKFLWGKFWAYLPPLLILAEVLTLVTNRMLNVSSAMNWLSAVT
ncbi:MAG: hypothetical protein HQK60_01005, partial [Deltaproteobacteria bacterium]|nr:hypothetical protein [Deltaproteobacteria bacterium]